MPFPSIEYGPCLHARSSIVSICTRATTQDEGPGTAEKRHEEGPMARRLSEMTEQAMLEGGKSARRTIDQAGFSEELKKQLEERLAASSFQSDHAAAHSIANIPTSAGQGTRDVAGAMPWTGTESVHDATLRMLDSSKKPARVPFKIPQPTPVKFQISPKQNQSPGLRLARAKEHSSIYSLSQNTGLSEEEKQAMHREMKERFSPGARAMPMTLQGLSSLANERIEDAMARGQFKRIARGKGINVQTDHNANSAFIDTTEYFMNKIIKQQEIVPPWIEKQQELAREIDRFRSRIRNDWRRHAARLIAREGGSLDAQMRRARAYAAAETRLADKARVEASWRETNPESSSSMPTSTESAGSSAYNSESAPDPDPDPLPIVPPLRDPDYLAIERSYHELAVHTINALARSYNLQAPPIAQKPYLNLERELAACYADVASSLADEIYRRATERVRPSKPAASQTAPRIMQTLSTTQASRVYDEDKSKGYGLKELWKDLFSK
ncbi:hypothetical protein ASPZODRAFT_151208 [Penicilliopsis zonata CBS 506.65]|uniref:DnaJ homologue subfamily C member 28 conserved domain-containing protein n=1 Tax=Penicilliopsis zonata CBS 506.65 TaxID=1073090 RepID=A0A1L9SKJ7_9EURO|nr:hypothetical protein ASPZODRAFT_151208 [Penicilliopsis zonata CBS 506.65]OJJ47759.1 hypothetical protein ASPZODRAFT_151208 [Penicilliopsis zonata CBS 506.65]